MFILSKEISKDIIKYRKEWKESIENEDLILALMNILIIPTLILFFISLFILDIIILPLEIIIYLKVRKVKKEKSTKKFQPTYKLNRKDSRKFKEWECMYERNK